MTNEKSGLVRKIVIGGATIVTLATGIYGGMNSLENLKDLEKSKIEYNVIQRGYGSWNTPKKELNDSINYELGDLK